MPRPRSARSSSSWRSCSFTGASTACASPRRLRPSNHHRSAQASFRRAAHGPPFFLPVLRFVGPGVSFGSRMATVPSLPGSPPAGGSSPDGPTYHVTTRELSADFTAVGPDQKARDLGTIDAAQFRRLLDQLAALEPIKLVDADPQLIVTVKNSRFLIQPQGGKLIVRPFSARDQMFFKLTPAEIPAFFEDAGPAPAKSFTTLIGSAAARAEAAPTAPAPRPVPAAPPARKTSRPIILAVLVAFALIVAGLAWIFF